MSVFALEERKIAFLYEVRGRGTRLLSRLSPGDELLLLGPLGRGWAPPDRPLALVAGGTGIAPIHFAAQLYGGDAFLGFRGKPYLVESFVDWCREVHVASETGEGGLKGVVTEIFRPEGYRTCFACGPEGMLRELHRICRGADVPLFVSVEERMACGLGGCLGCTVLTSRGPRKVCVDGPVFPVEELWGDG
jgi:dihydroorotate dehydrogenase electron transfer subunit